MIGYAERHRAEFQTPWAALPVDGRPFAVCRNFLGLSRMTGEKRYTELALRLVDRVHHTLGRHRGDDSRPGWISG